MQNARTFLRQERLKPNRTLRLEDIVTPGQEDVAQDYASDMQQSGGFQPPQQGMPYVTPDEQPEAEAPPVEAVGFNDATTKSEPPSNRRRALAQSLLEQGSQPFKSGAGWWGVADRLAATGVGAWMDSRETEREDATKKTALTDFLSSLDETDPVHKYAKSVALSGDVTKATDLILRHETQKQIAAMKAKNTGTGYKQRTYNKDGREITEQSNDGGTTWTPLANDTRYKPESQNGAGLTTENALWSAEYFVRTGDKSIFLRMPYKDVSAIRNLIPGVAKSMGLPQEKLAARIAEFNAFSKGLSTIATQQAKIDTIAAESSLFADQALAASKAIPRGQFVPGNRLLQDYNLMMSKPAYYSFIIANTDLAHAQAGVAGRGQTNQHLQELFEARLNTAASHEAYAAMVMTIKRAADAIMKAPAKTREHMIMDFVTKNGGDAQLAMRAVSEDRRISKEEAAAGAGEPVATGDAAVPTATAPADTTEYDYGTHKNGRKVRRKKGSKNWEYY